MKQFLVLWLVLWGVNQVLPPWYERHFVPASTDRTLPDVLLDFMGEGRTMLARILWFKMDLFHEVLDDQGVEFTQQTEVLPLLRMVTYLDPHLDDAYDVMAYDLFMGHGQTDQALAILDEGLRYNPQSRLLWFRKAMVLQKAQRYAAAEKVALTTLQMSTDDIDRLNILRVLYQACKAQGEWDQCRQVLEWWGQLRPDDIVTKPMWKEVREHLASSASPATPATPAPAGERTETPRSASEPED